MRDKLKEMLEEAQELNALGLMPDAEVQQIQTLAQMRALNKSIAALKEMSGDEIRAMRTRLGMSQSILAHAMGMSKESVSKWERNEVKPAGPALRILNLLDSKGLGILVG
ncbi:MAG: helix-turn-helix domain-containing protein [Scandinavium sp.]|uniref:helix-turn-helix domain-containing protein n=1 Tax=Scandinavium sp. TaxID=2830653 RepID=UPI003F397D97